LKEGLIRPEDLPFSLEDLDDEMLNARVRRRERYYSNLVDLEHIGSGEQLILMIERNEVPLERLSFTLEQVTKKLAELYSQQTQTN
jgi:hypothetical protein